MFIRQVKKQRSKDAKIFYQYTLVQSSRVNNKVKQSSILYLGSDPLLADKQNRGIVLSILKSKIFGQESLFPVDPPKLLLDLALNLHQKYLIRYQLEDEPTVSIPPKPELANFENIDIDSLNLTKVHRFGAEYLCKQVMDKLGLGHYLTKLKLNEQQVDLAIISIIARAIYSATDHKTAQILQLNSGLVDLFSYPKNISHKQLYAITDILYEHKDQIDQFLYSKLTDLFDLEDRLVIFDISNTYFETRKSNSELAQYGRSKEKRSDCPLVVFTGVINAQGFIRHSRIYQGNKTDCSTLEQMIKDLKKHSPKGKQTIVIDAGIATEENLDYIKSQKLQYVCVSRKRLKQYPVDALKSKTIELTNRGKNKVELAIFKPEGFEDTWMYVQSDAKRNKEHSMSEKLKERFEQDLQKIKDSLAKKRGIKQINKVHERIGRLKQKHRAIASQYIIEVEQDLGKATAINYTIKENKIQSDKEKGVYFIRTNIENPQQSDLWQIYNTIREVESTFRCLKSDLNIRPIHHQNDERIKAHIYQTILAYQLVNTIRLMLKQNEITMDWNNIVRIMNTQTIQTIELPTDKKIIHIRKPSKPIKEAKQIYDACKCSNTQKAFKVNVVYH